MKQHMKNVKFGRANNAIVKHVESGHKIGWGKKQLA